MYLNSISNPSISNPQILKNIIIQLYHYFTQNHTCVHIQIINRILCHTSLQWVDKQHRCWKQFSIECSHKWLDNKYHLLGMYYLDIQSLLFHIAFMTHSINFVKSNFTLGIVNHVKQLTHCSFHLHCQCCICSSKYSLAPVMRERELGTMENARKMTLKGFKLHKGFLNLTPVIWICIKLLSCDSTCVWIEKYRFHYFCL